MFVITYRKIFFALTGVFVALAVGAIGVFGLPFGIDFTGGTLAEVRYEERPARDTVISEINTVGLSGNISVRESGENGYIIRAPHVGSSTRDAFIEAATAESASTTIERFTVIGPVIGEELRNKALIALALVVLAIILYVAFSFRKVSEPVASWKYGLIAIAALIHDIIIPVGVFSLLGFLVGAEIDTLFVMALLAILGYSVNDTIVVFDRIRENLNQNKEDNRFEDFELTVGKSLKQTYLRSVNTSLTTAFVLTALFFIGAEATQYFALTLLVGVIAGTYSSIFLAAPLLVAVERLGRRK